MKNLKILLVENSDDMRDLIYFMLRTHEADVTAVPNAREGQIELAKSDFDIVISNEGVRCHAGDGSALCRFVKSNRPNTRFILISSLPKRFESEPDLFLRKPFRPEELHRAVMHVTGRR